MGNNQNFRVRVMKYAWQLWYVTKQSWRYCMIKAWELYRLAKAMKSGDVRFYYRKADGSIRKAVGTLKGAAYKAKNRMNSSYKTMTYFDVEKNAYRCFKVENLICKVV